MSTDDESTGLWMKLGPLAWAAWGVIVLAALTRALLTVETLPGWSIDPFRMVAPTTGVTPTQLLAVDLATMAAAGVMLLTFARRRGVHGWTLLLAAIGLVPVTWHAIGHGLDIESLTLGAAWSAAIFGAIAVAHGARDERMARLTAAAIVGVIGILALKGGMQVFLEHRETVRQFDANRDAFLAAQGLQPGSPGAAAFVRRLMQPEATGWFGLSNVFATFATGTLTMLAGWAVLSRRRVSDPLDRPSEGWAGMIGIGAAIATAALWFSHSKGGIGAGAIGVLMAVVIVMVSPMARPSWRRWAGITAVLMVAGVIAAVIARGIVGEKIGELSLLFRWFYWQGAARIFAEHPLAGVGPSGFKDAYAIAKPALSPEEVSSPHSIFIDYAATLGVGGLAWVVLVMSLVWRLGVAAFSLVEESVEKPSASTLRAPTDRSEARVVIGLAAVALTVSAVVERYALVPEAALARIIGLVLWALIALGVLSLLRTKVGRAGWRGVVSAAALAMMIHSQIELTPTWPTSAALLLLTVGLAAGPTFVRGWQRAGVALALVPLVVASVGGVMILPRVAAWEGHLVTAAKSASALGEIWRRIDLVSAGNGRGEGGEGMAQIATSVADAIGEFPAGSGVGFNQQLARLTAKTAEVSAAGLKDAMMIAPRHGPTRDAATRVWMLRASSLIQSGEAPTAEGPRAAFEAAVKIADGTARDAGGLNVRANVAVARHQVTGDPAFLVKALELWTEAAALDPHNWNVPMRAMAAAATLGRADEAKAWATKALELDALQRLDPLRRLREADRAVAERVARGEGMPGSAGSPSQTPNKP